MNWIELASGKQPKFGQYVFLYDQEKENYSAGKLDLVNESADGKTCIFKTSEHESGGAIVESHFTHYAIPTPPKKKA